MRELDTYRLLFSEYYTNELSNDSRKELEEIFKQHPDLHQEYIEFAATLNFINKGEIAENEYDFASMLSAIKQEAQQQQQATPLQNLVQQKAQTSRWQKIKNVIVLHPYQIIGYAVAVCLAVVVYVNSIKPPQLITKHNGKDSTGKDTTIKQQQVPDRNLTNIDTTTNTLPKKQHNNMPQGESYYALASNGNMSHIEDETRLLRNQSSGVFGFATEKPLTITRMEMRWLQNSQARAWVRIDSLPQLFGKQHSSIQSQLMVLPSGRVQRVTVQTETDSLNAVTLRRILGMWHFAPEKKNSYVEIKFFVQ
ncbi:MAG: hypothetical protein U0Y96_02380 [Candidatus Kapaibacterium sp.]|nr:hypothetical protein [Bacteroidota bacterium]